MINAKSLFPQMYLWELASNIRLLNSTDSIELKIDRMLDFFSDLRVKVPYFREYIELYDFNKEKFPVIVAIAAKARGESLLDFEDKVKKFPQDILALRKGEYPFPYFGKPANTLYTGQDILNLGFLPHGCTANCILAYDLLKLAGINCQVMYMTLTGRKNGHTIIRYENSNKQWRRCDPSWEKRIADGGPVFFKHNPHLREEFASERRPFLHGARNYDPDESGKIRQIEFEKEIMIRPITTTL